MSRLALLGIAGGVALLAIVFYNIAGWIVDLGCDDEQRRAKEEESRNRV